MPKSKNKQSISDQDITWPLIDRMTPIGAITHSGRELLERLGKTAKEGSQMNVDTDSLAKQPENRFLSANELQVEQQEQQKAKRDQGKTALAYLDYLGKFIFSVIIPLLLLTCCCLIALSRHAR